MPVVGRSGGRHGGDGLGQARGILGRQDRVEVEHLAGGWGAVLGGTGGHLGHRLREDDVAGERGPGRGGGAGGGARHGRGQRADRERDGPENGE